MSEIRTLSIIIPTYNEAATIAEVVHRVLSAKISLSRELVIVDDCSTDGTRDLLKRLEQDYRAEGGVNDSRCFP